MADKVLVIGHKNPDTDAICSAIGYAWFLNQTSHPGAEAACCGEIHARTQFVLGRAGIEPPRLVMDVRPTVGSIMRRGVITARAEETIFAVYRRMQQHGLRAMPVVGADGRLKGLLSFSRLMELVLPDHDVDQDSRVIQTSLHRVAAVLGGQFAHAVDPTRDERLLVMVAAMSAEGFTGRMKQFPPGQTVIVSGDRPTIHLPALEYGVRCLIITGGYTLSPSLLGVAAQQGVSILYSPHDTATTTLLLRSAKVVEPAVAADYLQFIQNAPVDKAARAVATTTQELFPVVDETGCLAGVFAKSDLVNPQRIRLVLVDHNELAQAVEGAEQADILEVIDHHRLGGGLVSREPIRFVNEPFGSTCTIIAKFLHHREWQPPRPIGLCLVAGIISDTLNLTSPTTTPVDRDMLGWLAGPLDIDLDRFTADFFAAGSVLDSYTADQAVRLDSKDYSEGPWRFAVAQIEELGLDHFWKHKDALRAALDKSASRRRLDFAALMVTDISSHRSILMVAGPPLVRNAIDYPRLEDGVFEMAGVVSRKKQLLPHLIRTVAKLEK